MTVSRFPYQLFPLGDSAVTIDYGNLIDELINKEVIARFNEFSAHPLPCQKELVPAYSSITVYFDVLSLKKKHAADQSAFEHMQNEMVKRLSVASSHEQVDSELIKIPVCYDPEYAPDLISFCEHTNLHIEELLSIHTATVYKVYMMGFLPGFSYMGQVDERIAMARKPQPELVMAGGVGIAGRQTGIYPLDSPGGWHIIGRCPLKIFDAKREDPSLIKAGDRIQFYPISRHEYTDY
jgi:inhibitor of KinA